MSQLTSVGQAGTVESNDVLVTISLAPSGHGLQIELNSPVSRQFGRQMRSVILDVLQQHGVTDAKVLANDKGALDCTIRARVKTALSRAMKQEGQA